MNAPRRHILVLAALLAVLVAGMSAPAQAADPTNPSAAGNTLSEEGQAPAPDLNSNPDVYLELISRLQAKSLYFASLAHLDAFDRRWPDKPQATLLRADALRETGYPDKAATLYESLLQGPLAAHAQHGLGLIASKGGNLDSALLALDKANQLDPTNAAILNDLGYVQILLQRMADAGFNLHKATELDPKNVRAGANLALYYLMSDKPERAQGIMDWYRLKDTQRKEINEKAAELAKRIRP
ncbi:MAG: pilus assembly protein [Thiobacillus sp.]|nr:pilus assembly protein [Thiobacillus sp.]